MGFLDDILAQGQNGGGMLGGLQLSPAEQQMLGLSAPAAPVWPDPAARAAAPPTALAAPDASVFSQGPSAAPAQSGGAFPASLPAPLSPIDRINGGFAALPAAPIFANPNSSLPGMPGVSANNYTPPSPAVPAAAVPVVAASDDDEEDAPAVPAQASSIAVGGYQMPRIGPAAAFAPNPAALPANAQPTQGQAPVPAAAPSIGDKLMAGYQNMHHGGGLIGSIVAAVTGQRNDTAGVALQQQQQVANMTARALIAKGVDPQVAIAAVQPGNTEALKELFKTALMGGTHAQETDKDGNVWDVNKQTGQRTIALQAKDDKFQPVKTKNFDGSETNTGAFNTKTGEYSGVPAASGTSGLPGFGQLLAQGVTYDPNKSGEDYMNQFSPEVQAAAKAYINGDVMPTGNARKNSIATFAKTVAQKYSMDTGAPVNDTIYAAKRKMQTDLASSGNSTMGGILSNGESSFSHLAEYTKSAADLGNASHDYPLGGVIAHLQNSAGNSMGGSDTQAKIKAINDNLGHYGQESTKFYSGTGGGVEERMNALKEMNPNSVSGEEAASYAEKEKGLMLDRLNTKFQEIRNTLGEERGNAEIAKHMPSIQKNIETIDANIARLRGQAPANAKPATVTQNGHTYNLQPDGSYK